MKIIIEGSQDEIAEVFKKIGTSTPILTIPPVTYPPYYLTWVGPCSKTTTATSVNGESQH